MFFDVKIDESTTTKINELCNERIREVLEKDKEMIDKIIYESIKGSIKSRVNEILQSDKFRSHLRDEIMKQLNIKEFANEG